MFARSKLRLDKIVPYLLEPQSVLSMALLRIALGVCVMFQAYRKGARVFSGTAEQDGLAFVYQLFEWVKYSPDQAELLAFCWFVSGLAFAAGFMFRVTAPICTLLTIYQFLISPEAYLNHEYMAVIFLLLMSVGPSHHRLSIDRLIWRFPGFAPRYHLLTLRIQTEIILVYAGLVKINADWLQLQPLSNWLIDLQDLFFLGSLWNQQWAVAVGAYGIILLHVFGAPLLFFRRTRLWIFLLYIPFHLTNAMIFLIDIFPWMTIAATTLFFEPDWPGRVLAAVSARIRQVRDWSYHAIEQTAVMHQPGRLDLMLLSFYTLWLFMQIVIPTRPMLYPGPVAWTGEGHRFSWRMMLDRKTCPTMLFVITDQNSQVFFVVNPKTLMFTPKVERICREPDHILRLAHQIRERHIEDFHLPENTRIYAVIMKSVNYRAASLYADPTVDLGQEKLSFKHYSWILAQEKLNALPPPFKNFENNSEMIDWQEAVQLADIDADGTYDCQSYQPFKTGQGVYCKRQLYGDKE